MLSDFQAASVLQASGFRFDVTVFRSVQRPRANVAGNLRLGGIRRNACTESRRLITRSSQVQIPPPLLTRGPGNGAFCWTGETAPTPQGPHEQQQARGSR